jgi:hypothetical protein
LAVLAADLGHDPRRAGVAVPGEWTRRERELALAVARRSLRSRRVLTDGGSGPEMAYAVAVLVDIVCAPVTRVELFRGGAGQPVRFLVQPDATVRVELRDGLHRFTPFATGDLLRWIAVDSGLDTQPAGSGEAVELSARSYIELRRALRTGSEAAAAQAVAGSAAGLSPVLLAALAEPGRERSLAVRRRSGTVIVGGEVAWVDTGTGGLWSLPTIDQPMAGGSTVDDVDGSAVVRLEPVSGEALTATIVGFLRDAA